jgi:hypothetical protein
MKSVTVLSVAKKNHAAKTKDANQNSSCPIADEPLRAAPANI